ncbi:MAG: hypothetical protein AMXMBFR12_01300 [Candidatus Babeliales bacterium]
MNRYFTLKLGLLLTIPTFFQAAPKNKVNTSLKFLVGSASTVSAGIILYNITKMAQRRLANPDYSGSRSIRTLLAQDISILWHNKPLALVIIFALGVGVLGISCALQDLQSQSLSDQQS